MGSVKIGSTQSRLATLTNSGGSSVTVSQASVTGRGFGINGLAFPMTLAAGESRTFSVTFAPQSAGNRGRKYRSFQQWRRPGHQRAGFGGGASCRNAGSAEQQRFHPKLQRPSGR